MSMKNECRDSFDHFAREYHSTLTKSVKKTGADSNYYCEYRVQFVRTIVKETGGTILDYGCGNGTTARYLRNYFPNHHIAGADTSQKSIEMAEENKTADMEFLQLKENTIPYPNNTFDLVFIAQVFHHVPFEQQESILRECNRVLRENGLIFIFEHNPLNPITRKIVNDCVFDKDAILIKPRHLEKELGLTGYTGINLTYHLFFPRHKIFRWLLPMEKWLHRIPIGGQYCLQAKKTMPH